MFRLYGTKLTYNVLFLRPLSRYSQVINPKLVVAGRAIRQRHGKFFLFNCGLLDRWSEGELAERSAVALNQDGKDPFRIG